jgi:hypothetical protein
MEENAFINGVLWYFNDGLSLGARYFMLCYSIHTLENGNFNRLYAYRVIVRKFHLLME